MAYLILNAANGALVKSFYEIDTSSSTVSTTYIPMGFFIDSSNQLYCLTWKTGSNLFYVSSYTFTAAASTLSPSYSKSYGGSLNMEIGISALFIP